MERKREALNKHHRLVNWWVRWEDLQWPNHDGHDRIKRRAAALAKADVSAYVLLKFKK